MLETTFGNPSQPKNRRQFIKNLYRIVGSASLLSLPVLSNGANAAPAANLWTVGQIMDLFIKEVPGAPFKETVDTLKAGSRDTKVTGIVTSMFPTLDVIEQAIRLKANFIIVHEPTYYNHQDETEWLQHDEVYRYKSDLLKKHNIAIWRNHDYIHSLTKDGVFMGVAEQLGWVSEFDLKTRTITLQSPATLQAVIDRVKTKLHIPTLRFIGDLSQPCRKILLSPGATMGKWAIEALSREKPDVIVCGEIHEWETAEYVRDARAKGQNLSLVIMGHTDSEEPGSEFMANWLKEKVPGIPITHIPAKTPFSFR